MANAKKCDRCGRYYEHNVRVPARHGGYIGQISTLTHSGNHVNTYDLCDDCVAKLIVFIRGAELKGE